MLKKLRTIEKALADLETGDEFVDGQLRAARTHIAALAEQIENPPEPVEPDPEPYVPTEDEEISPDEQIGAQTSDAKD